MIRIQLVSHDRGRKGSVTWDKSGPTITVESGTFLPREVDAIYRVMAAEIGAQALPPEGQLDGGAETRHTPVESEEAFRYAVDLLPSRAWVQAEL